MSASILRPESQIVAVIDAGFWEDDEERYRAGLLELDGPALALVGEMFRVRALHDDDEDLYCGLVGPLYDLFNAAIAYSRYGTDPTIAARFRDLVDESLHEEQLIRMEAEVEAVELQWSKDEEEVVEGLA